MVLLYIALFSTLTILKHEAFETTAFDLGNMDQAVWNSVRGRFLPFTNWGEEGTRLAYSAAPGAGRPGPAARSAGGTAGTWRPGAGGGTARRA